jgi:hypothetical protein
LVKTRLQPQSLAGDGDHHINRHRDPDLRLHSVVTGTIEGLNSQVLLDPLKQLNDILPINSALLKSQSITASIPCVRTA